MSGEDQSKRRTILISSLDKEVDKKPTSDSIDALIDALAPHQRRDLLSKYVEGNQAAYQPLLDQLLKTIANKESPSLLTKYKREISSKSSIKKGKGSELQGQELVLLNELVLQDYNRFWFQSNVRDKSKAATGDTLQLLNNLASYVPKIVLRRLLQNPNPIKPPEIESFPACVMFADISGFTPLTEKLASQGVQGIERLTHELNAYFDKLINTVYKHGGDILKFAGDAVLVMWPCESRPALPGMILLACQCAKSLINDLGEYQVADTGCILRLHIGIGAGEIGSINIGGANNQVEFFISGQVLEQVSSCEKQAQPGEVFVSAVAWLLVPQGRLVGVQKGKEAISNYRLDKVEIPQDLPPEDSPVLYPDMEASLSMYCQPAVLKQIKSGGKRALGELRSVTVIFVNLTAPFKEYQLPDLQVAIFKMQETIYKLQGTVRQFMIDDKGSVFIAGFGLPPAHENDAIRAVEAALEIHSLLQGLKIPCSIGVTTGKAFCGDVGSTGRREYAMVGDIVNLSARLMVAAKQGILTDQDTYEAAKTSKGLSFQGLSPIKVKGKVNPINIFIPSKNKQKTTTVQEQVSKKGLKTMTPIVGREGELRMLKNTIQKLKQLDQKKEITLSQKKRSFISKYNASVIIIEGEDGVGKTRLVTEIEAMMKEADGKVFVGFADQLTMTKQYDAWGDIFHRILDEAGAVPEQYLANLDKDQLPLLNGILPIDLPEGPKLANMSAQQRGECTKNLLMDLLKKIVTPGSLIVLENAQWLDSASWGLALAASKLNGVLLVISMRPMKSISIQLASIQNLPNTQTIRLTNLTEEKTTTMIANCLGVKKVPDELIRQVYNKSQGNPFVTEEIVSAVRDSLQFTRFNEVIITPEAEQMLKTVPENISGLIISKIDKLQPSQKLTLKVASVIGRAFTLKMLQTLMESEGESKNVKKDLGALERLGFISSEELPNSEWMYTFGNILVREVCYNMMLFQERRNLHNRIADIILQDHAGDTSYYSLLGYHLKESENYEKAIHYFLQAGRISLSSYANKDAASFFTDAIKCTEKVSSEDTLELIGAERKLGICYYNLGQLSRADEHLRKALDLMGITIGNDPKAKGTKAVSAWKYTKQKELKQPDELIFRKREAVLLLLQLAKVNLYDCNKAVSWQCSSFALALSSEIGQAEYAEALSLSAITAEMNGESSIADQHIAKAVEAAGKQLDVLKKVLQISGMVYSGRGDFEKANDCLVRARDAATTIGDLKSWEETSVLLGTLYFLKGQIAESTEITEQVLDSARERGDLQSQVLALNAQARNYYALGDVESCWRCLEDVNIAFETLGASDVSAKMDYFALNALVRARVGDFETTWKIIVTNLFDQITKADVTPYFTIFAISDTIDATISLLSNPHVWVNSSPLNGKITKSKMQSKAEKLITFLGRFASIYAIAQPRLELFKGMFAHSKGKSFEKELTKGIEKAKAMGMIYDYACGIHDKGSFSNNPALTKQALDIYPELASRGKDWTEHKSLVGARKAFKILGD